MGPRRRPPGSAASSRPVSDGALVFQMTGRPRHRPPRPSSETWRRLASRRGSVEWPRMRSREHFALLACAAIAAACGRSDGESSASKTGADVAPAPVVASSDASPAAPLPPAGMVQAWRGDDALVSAFANQAMRGVILQLLAEKAGFELVLGADAGLEQTLTVRAEREPLEVVL